MRALIPPPARSPTGPGLLQSFVAGTCTLSLAACVGVLSGPPDAGVGTLPPPGDEQIVEMRRLTSAQVHNSLSDVIGERFVPTDLPLDADPLEGDLSSIGSADAVTSGLAAEQYLTFFTAAADALWADQARRQAFVGDTCTPREANDPCIRSFFQSVALKAWRRPTSQDEVDQLVAVVAAVSDASGRDLWSGLEYGLIAVLASPNFLYRVELGAPPTAAAPTLRYFTGYEMAQRLAFTLWDSLPDDALLAAAAADQLGTADEVRAQARRMLADPVKGRRGVLGFFSENFELDRLGTLVRDPTLFPNLSPTLPDSMREQLSRDIEEAVFREGGHPGGLLDLLDSTGTQVNADLAALYGFDSLALDAGQWTPVSYPPGGPRAGIVGTAGILAAASRATRSSPTLRGRFVRQSLLCQAILNPPPNVNTTLDDGSGDGGTDAGNAPLTLVEQLREHATNPACSGCHNLMDPIGAGLESFDAIGALKATPDAGTDAGTGLDADAGFDFDFGYIDDPKVTFADARALGALLRTDPRPPACFARQLQRWSLGRVEKTPLELGFNDQMMLQLKSTGDARDVIVELLASDLFRATPDRHVTGDDQCAP